MQARMRPSCLSSDLKFISEQLGSQKSAVVAAHKNTKRRTKHSLNIRLEFGVGDVVVRRCGDIDVSQVRPHPSQLGCSYYLSGVLAHTVEHTLWHAPTLQ